jgi:hypothetical protein
LQKSPQAASATSPSVACALRRRNERFAAAGFENFTRVVHVTTLMFSNRRRAPQKRQRQVEWNLPMRHNSKALGEGRIQGEVRRTVDVALCCDSSTSLPHRCHNTVGTHLAYHLLRE